MARKKKQHYVPKFYFRLFSQDGKNIRIYNTERKKMFSGPFKSICYENYFYSKGPEIEDGFAPLEQKLQSIIQKVVHNKSLSAITKEEYIFLLLFILFQKVRTKMEKIDSKQYTDYFVENVMKPFMLSDPEIKKSGITKETLDSIKITYPADHLEKIFTALTAAPLIGDLIPVLLINETPKDFVFSDAPVVFYNTFFNKDKDSGRTAFQSLGLQIFCPLSKKLMLMLFDKEFYHITHNPDFTVVIDSDSDVDSLNALQFFNCEENIYFSDKNQLKHIEDLHSKLPHPIVKPKLKIKTYKSLRKPDGSYSEILHSFTRNIDYELTLTFMRLNSSPRITSIVRNPKLMEAYKIHMNELEKRKFKKKEK